MRLIARTMAVLSALVVMSFHLGQAAAQGCNVPTEVQDPELYPIGWIPWIGDLKSWRNYNAAEIPRVGRLIPSPNGMMVGEPLAAPPTCDLLQSGEYTYVMKWQENETAANYVENTDVIYLKQRVAPGPDYIRHSQIASGFPVFCAGTFKIAATFLGEVNEVVEITNFSGHYKPKCKCLGVLEEKLSALNVNTSQAVYKFLGTAEECTRH